MLVNGASAAGFIDMCVGIMALEIFFLLDPTAPSMATAPPLDDSAAELLLPLAAAGTLLTSVALIYHHLTSRAAAAAAATNRRLSGFAIFLLCVSAGVLDIFFFVVGKPAAGGAVDRGAQARALGMGALRALPTAAAANFFWGIMLIIVAHVVGAGHGAVQGHMRVLTKVAVGAAAGLVFLVTVAAFGIKY
ncbi:unnamed protein product [Urochloa humidicola]